MLEVSNLKEIAANNKVIEIYLGEAAHAGS